MSNACACMNTLVLMKDLRVVPIYALLAAIYLLLLQSSFKGLFTVTEDGQIQNPRMPSMIVYYQE